MIEKDLQNIDCLKNFPRASLLICQFHVIKYLKSIFADYDLQCQRKEGNARSYIFHDICKKSKRSRPGIFKNGKKF